MLTEKIVEKEKAESKDKIIWDKRTKGLGLKVTPKGTKTFFLNYYINGRYRRITLGRPYEISLKDARKKAAEHLEGIRMNGIDPLEKKEQAETVNQGLKFFFEEYAPRRIRRGKLKESTLNEYRLHAEKYIGPRIGHLRIEEVSRKQVEKMVEDLPNTQHNRVLALAQRLFNLWIEEALRTSANPVTDIERADEQVRQRVLSNSEFSALFKVLSGMEEKHPAAVGAIKLASFSGLRISEALSIRWYEVDTDSGRVEIPDSKSGQRVHSIGKNALQVIAQQKRFKGCDWVFTNDGRSKATYKVVRARFAEAVKSAGLRDVRLHDLRRTAINRLALSGASAPTIQAYQGHKTLDASMRYVTSVNSNVHEARQFVDSETGALMDMDGGEGEGGFRTIEAARMKDHGQIQLIAEKEKETL